MESRTAERRVQQPDLELLRVGSTIFSILFGAMFLLSLPFLVRDIVNNATYLGRSLMTVTANFLIFVGLLARRSSRYARSYVYRWNKLVQMSRAARTRLRVLAAVLATGLLILIFLGPSLVGAVFWPGQTWLDYWIAAQPVAWLVGSAGFAVIMLWRWMDWPHHPQEATA